eukprot:7339707-Pyramimonas_sp.AAC.1
MATIYRAMHTEHEKHGDTTVVHVKVEEADVAILKYARLGAAADSPIVLGRDIHIMYISPCCRTVPYKPKEWVRCVLQAQGVHLDAPRRATPSGASARHAASRESERHRRVGVSCYRLPAPGHHRQGVHVGGQRRGGRVHVAVPGAR